MGVFVSGNMMRNKIVFWSILKYRPVWTSVNFEKKYPGNKVIP